MRWTWTLMRAWTRLTRTPLIIDEIQRYIYCEYMISTFDIHLLDKEYKKYSQKYGSENVILIQRDGIYRNIYIVLPSLGFLAIMIVFMIFWVINNIDYSAYWYFKVSIVVVWLLFFLYRISDKVLNYYLDFTIITPLEIVQYDQKWFFSRPMKTVASEKIKTISIRKWGIMQSVFNFGTLIFLSEWDEQWRWDIEIYFVHKPEEKKERIRNILKQL